MPKRSRFIFHLASTNTNTNTNNNNNYNNKNNIVCSGAG
jgi:hypothetical protein